MDLPKRIGDVELRHTRTGVRLVQHGTVLSEILNSPGPTHSVADALAAASVTLATGPRVGLLGFAGGGLLAPLRAMGGTHDVKAVDLDHRFEALFHKLCGRWAPPLTVDHMDAAAWLESQRKDFDVIIDDLSIPRGGDVFKPDITWDVLPELIKDRLKPDGIAVFNLLKPQSRSWSRGILTVIAGFAETRLIWLDDFENRLVVASQLPLPSARQLAKQMRDKLVGISSNLARRMTVRSR